MISMNNTNVASKFLPSIIKTLKPADTLIILGFALFSLLYFLGHWQGISPFVILGGDAANIASFAAAWDHPNMFQGDGILDNPDNFRFYATVHVPLLRILGKVFGDYGSAFIYLLAPHVFFQALGFYILGRVVFQNRYWAALLAIASWMPIWFNIEFWGIYQTPIPRFSFQAFLPYLLAAAFYWRSKPTAWPWILAFAGALIYVHPVSAPTIAFAIWLSFWLFLPTSYSLPKKITYMLFVGAISLSIALPFVIHYLGSFAHSKTANYEQVYEIIKIRFARGYLDIPLAIKEFFIILWVQRLLPLAIIGAGLVLWLRREDRKSVLFIYLWFAGILIASGLIPMIDHAIARAYNRTPIQYDLVRGLRYLVPILLLFCLWALAEFSKKINSQITLIVGVLLVSVWTYQNPPNEIYNALYCWRQGKLVCNSKDYYTSAIEALNAIKILTPPNARIQPSIVENGAVSLAVRYYAIRPVVYSGKDGGALAYANHTELIKWYEKYRAALAIPISEKTEAQLNSLLDFSRKVDAQYFLTDLNEVSSEFTPPSWATVIYKNESFSLYKISQNISNLDSSRSIN